MELLPPILFDRARLRKRRKRAAKTFTQHDFLWQEAAARAEESLSLIARDFPTVLTVGGHALPKRPGSRHWINAGLYQTTKSTIVMDEEFLPFAENSLDAVIFLLNLHWVNDLPGVLTQIRQALKPDGLFFAILPGGETLRELRSIFASVEADLLGGASARIAPFIDVRDAGALLQRAGFALPVTDSELLQVSYPHLFALMEDLRGAGEVNMLQQQAWHFTPRKFFIEAAKHYAERYSDAEGRITASVEFITLTGWKPAATQQQPAKRGSGKVSLREALS